MPVKVKLRDLLIQMGIWPLVLRSVHESIPLPHEFRHPHELQVHR